MSPISRQTACLLAAGVAAASSAAFARTDIPITAFTTGDLVVLRGGDDAHPNLGAAGAGNYVEVPVYLDEYTRAGAYVGTLPINYATGAPDQLTLPNNITNSEHEGILDLSANAQYLTFAGYCMDPNTFASPQTSGAYLGPANAVPICGKRLGVVAYSAATLDTSTVVHSYGIDPVTGALSDNPYLRGAVTDYGSNFWTFGKYPTTAGSDSNGGGAESNGGLAYVQGTGANATTSTVEGFADWRDIILVNGQMYGGCGSSSIGTHGPYLVNNTAAALALGIKSMPTTNLGDAQSMNSLLGAYPGGQSTSALALVALPGDPNTQDGMNVMYTIGDQSVPGITKYYYNGSTWSLANFQVSLSAANNIITPTGLLASQDPNNPNWVDLTVSGANGIYTYVDKGGYNGALPYNAFTLLVAPQANQSFYGLAPAPVQKGDVNADNHIDAKDLDLMGALVKNGTGSANAWDAGLIYDLDQNGVVNRADIDVLVHDVLQTNYGDANLDRKITPDDYLAIDAGYLLHKAGWANGDFNGDGAIDAQDYALIDASYLAQGGPSADEMIALHEDWFGPGYAAGLGLVPAAACVPEPVTLGLLATAALGLLGRRPRRAVPPT